MAQITTQRSRKEYKCCKCGKTINTGDQYRKVTLMRQAPHIYCLDCKVNRAHTTSSEYLQRIYELQDAQAIDEFEEINQVRDELDELKTELEERFDNLPEGLKEASTGQTMQERIEALDEAISSLESIEEFSYEILAEDFDSADFADEDECEEAINSELATKLSEAQLMIEDILGGLEL